MLSAIFQPLVVDDEDNEEDEAIQDFADNCWGDYTRRQQFFPFSGQEGAKENLCSESSPLDISTIGQ